MMKAREHQVNNIMYVFQPNQKKKKKNPKSELYMIILI